MLSAFKRATCLGAGPGRSRCSVGPPPAPGTHHVSLQDVLGHVCSQGTGSGAAPFIRWFTHSLSRCHSKPAMSQALREAVWGQRDVRLPRG